MVNIKDIFKKFSGKEVHSVFDNGKTYLASVTNKGDSIDEALDCMYSVDKNTGKIEIFSVAERATEFRDALKKPLYLKKKK